MVLGITGNIASGKSAVSALFRDLGAEVLSADELAREVVAPGGAVLRQLVARFGQGILQPDGTLDRPVLGRIIFADAGARAELNRIIHPAIAELSVARLEQLRGRGLALVVYEAPLLFEAGARSRVDRVLCVCVDPEVQLRRLMARDGIDEAAALQKMAAQMPQQEKVALSDFMIDNSGSLEQTRAQVEELFSRLCLGGCE